jgi:hypothetical protein
MIGWMNKRGFKEIWKGIKRKKQIKNCNNGE